MPFLTLNNDWSKLADRYNQAFSNKPEVPRIKYNSFDDGLIRGGVLNVGIAAVRDTARIGNFYLSGRGASFLIKQVGLQKSNPKLEELPDTRTLSNSNTRLYNLGVNTLAQVPINALGGHIIRHGILPVGGVGFLEGDSRNNINGYNYENIVLTNDREGRNRLINYLSYYQGNPNPKGPNGATYNPNDTTPMLLQEYNGGANSVYGIGKTQIFSTTVRTDFKNDLSTNNNFLGLTYGGLKEWFDTYKTNTNSGTLNASSPTAEPTTVRNSDADFSVYQGITGSLFNEGIKPIDIFKTKNIQSRLGTSTSKYGPNNIKQTYKVDSINVIDIVNSSTFYGNSLKPNSDPAVSSYLNKGNNEVDGYFGRDIIKFRIEFLNNDNPVLANAINGEAINTDVLAFRAYIDEFNDGMNAKWNPYRYMGRGEEFYVYEGFTRDISVGFTIFAHSPEEMKPIYRKLNYLMSSFAPDYSSQLKMRGNISYLTVGDYLYRQPGIFTDIKLSGMLDSHWEIALDAPEKGFDKGQYELPKHIKVNLSFKPIHTFLPRKVQAGKYADTPFITVDKKAYPTQAGAKYDSNGKLVQAASNKYLD